MTWQDLETIFDRAFKFSFEKRKIFLTFPLLVLSGLIFLFCHALSVGSGKWLFLSLTFLPVFLSAGIFLAGGVILTKVYHYEMKEIPFDFKNVLKQSWQMLINVSYLSLPLILSYLCLWSLMGVFYLLKEIPLIGTFVTLILSFGPFLLVFASIVLGIFNVVILFFVTPEAALRSEIKLSIALEIYQRVSKNILRNILLIIMALMPLIICAGVLLLALYITKFSFFHVTNPASVFLQWFFVMLPFCALLTPGVVFFFNFAAECFIIDRKKVTQKKPVKT